MLGPVSNLLLAEGRPDIGRTLVVDDPELATHLSAGLGASVRAYCDDLRDESRTPKAVRVAALTPATLAGVQTVLARAPKSLGALDELAQAVAASAAPSVRMLVGGRVKHLNRSMNEVLARHFVEVRASLGRSHSRVLHARTPLPDSGVSWPRRNHIARLGLDVVAHGAAFAGARLDAGTSLLIGSLPPIPAGLSVDLGCGTGLIASWLARRGDEVTAIDVSAAACASTAATAEANHLAVKVLRADGLTSLADRSVDAVVCNPPFHRGTAKDSGVAMDMIADAARVLVPGGELWLVFNSHLPYLPLLRSAVGPTRIEARDRSYLVTRATAR